MKLLRLLTILFILSMSHLLMAAPMKTIRFATEATYPPFEFIDESGQITGFDIDIAKALCQQIKAQCTFSNQSFNSLIPSLKLGKFDAIIAAMGITSERQKAVDFTSSYYEPSASFVALRKPQFSMLGNMNGTVGVQQGTVFEKYLKDKYKDITIKTYASAQDAFLDLVSGRLDAVLVDTPIADALLSKDQNNKNYSVVVTPIVDHDYFGSGYGIAVNKNNNDLLNAFNKALDEIKANGTYKKIVKKYFILGN